MGPKGVSAASKDGATRARNEICKFFLGVDRCQSQARSEPMFKEDREMRTRSLGSVILLTLLALVMGVAGCKHQAAAVPPPAPPPAPPAAPPPPVPTVTLQANPVSHPTRAVHNADLDIHERDGIELAPQVGTVAPQGSMTVTPRLRDLQHYRDGAGRLGDANVRVTVTPPPPPARPLRRIHVRRSVHSGGEGCILRP